jgi:NADPH:quinone reductase-like Zn-dependent oxidoreductase
MRAVVADAFGEPDVLRLVDVAVPEPGSGQVRVAVHAAALNPVDVATRLGLLRAAGLHGEPPVRFGWDAVGRIDAIGAGVYRVKIGDRVLGVSDRLTASSKTHADAVVLDETGVAVAPDTLDAAVAASLPLAGLTAIQALNRLALDPGQRVLITGAGGSIGSLATQLARLRGLHVVAAGRSQDEATARALGAVDFVPADGDLATAVRQLPAGPVDGALDAAGIGVASLDAVRARGAHISLNVTERPAPLRSIRSESVAITADWEQLTVLAALASTGALRVDVTEQLGLDEIREAHQLLAAAGRRGRIVVFPNAA